MNRRRYRQFNSAYKHDIATPIIPNSSQPKEYSNKYYYFTKVLTTTFTAIFAISLLILLIALINALITR